MTQSREERDKSLDELSARVDEWVASEKKEIEEEVALAKQMLRSRSGSDRIEWKTINQLSALANHNAARLLGASDRVVSK